MSTEISNEYTPESTLITFPKPIPLIRIPIPDNPNQAQAQFILAFPNQKAFLNTLETTKTKLKQQCLSGSRVGCSISASNKCRTPWWKFGQRVDYKVKVECEEREMDKCLVGCEEKCVDFAMEKCMGSFSGAWVRNVDRGGLFSGSGSGSGSGLGFVRGSEILGSSDCRIKFV